MRWRDLQSIRRASELLSARETRVIRPFALTIAPRHTILHSWLYPSPAGDPISGTTLYKRSPTFPRPEMSISRILPFLCIFASFIFPGVPQTARADGYSALTVSTPLVLSASLGYRFVDASEPKKLAPSVEGEVGVGGGRILIGLDTLDGEGGGWGFRGGLMHTWLSPIDVETDNTYLGAQVDGAIGRVGLQLGLYQRVQGEDDPTVVLFGLSLRF